MKHSKIFKSGNSQALRLPKDFNLKNGDVLVSKVGELLIAVPENHPWAPFLASLQLFSDDFMEDRVKSTTRKKTA